MTLSILFVICAIKNLIGAKGWRVERGGQGSNYCRRGNN